MDAQTIAKILPENPTYIGDGVYAFFDGYMIGLSLGDHRNPPAVWLEPEVMDSLNRFNDQIKQLRIEATK